MLDININFRILLTLLLSVSSYKHRRRDMREALNIDVLNRELNIVYKYLLKKGVPHIDAQDAVQETALKYIKLSDTIRSSKVRSWLIRVALNYHYDQCRKNKKYHFNLDEHSGEPESTETPEALVISKERARELSSILNQLKPFYAEILLLKYQSNFTYEEIAIILGISIGAVKINLYRARKKLLKCLEEARDDES